MKRALIQCMLSLVAGFAAGATEPSALSAEGFAIPQSGRQFVFPRDHGSHPEFSIEWWYLTGHLSTGEKEEFGFQATFFRRALLSPREGKQPNSSSFGNDQIYLAHMALVDKTTGLFHYQERLNRAGWDASASTETLDVRNGNWSLRLCGKKSEAHGREVIELRGSIGAEGTLALELTPKKPLVIFGADGVSRKAADPEAASHYLTYPRLAAKGTLSVGDVAVKVNGEAWMDHEFSSSQLGEGQVGWDWLSLQLFDGREVMAYRMRRADGGTDPFSTVAWIDAEGSVSHVGPNDFQWSVLERWRSRKTGIEYPALVILTAKNPATGKNEIFVVQPVVAAQELTGKIGGVTYWEGACRVLNSEMNEVGRAYMELTGYGDSIKGTF